MLFRSHVPAADAVSVAEHAASVMTNDAVQATSAAIEDTREEFTDVTLQAHRALPSPPLISKRLVRAVVTTTASRAARTPVGRASRRLSFAPDRSAEAGVKILAVQRVCDCCSYNSS